MKRLMTTTTALLALTAGAAIAATDIDAVDLDGNGFASIEELRATYPELSVEFFRQMDQNDDNRIGPQEILETEAQDILARYEAVPMEQRTPQIVLDADSDGFITYDDMLRAYPDLTELDYDTLDANDDNRVSYEEFYALDAQEVVGRYEIATSLRDISEIDTDGDEFASFDEMVTVYPGLDQTNFENIDTNGDNRISSNELYAPDAQTILGRF